jgi:hypothetical protein
MVIPTGDSIDGPTVLLIVLLMVLLVVLATFIVVMVFVAFAPK